MKKPSRKELELTIGLASVLLRELEPLVAQIVEAKGPNVHADYFRDLQERVRWWLANQPQIRPPE